MLPQADVIDDDYIIKYFPLPNGRINSNFTSKDYLLIYAPKVYNYLINRYDDSESLYETVIRIIRHIEERPKCPICGKRVSYRGRKGYLFNDTCGEQCAYLYRRQNMIEKYGKYINNGGTEESIKKAKQTKLERYGTEGYNNREKSKQTCLEKYGRPYSSDIEKIKQTCLEKYGGMGGASQSILEKMKQTCLEKYGVDNYRKSEECKQKIVETKRKHNKMKTSQIEEDCYNWLCEEYGIDNIIRQYKDIRYINLENNHLYWCDFYIKTKDIFIEIQGYWGHGPHPFDENNKEDLALVEKWKECATKKEIYKRAIEGWINDDVKKRKIAKQNNLRYIEIFDRKITKEKLLKIISDYDTVQKNQCSWYN